MKTVEGNKSKSELVKEKGQAIGHASSHDASGKTAEHGFCGNLRELGFKAGRTIELRRFEFCRVGLSVRSRVKQGDDVQSVREALEVFVTELLKREEAAVSNGSYTVQIPDSALETLAGCVCRCIQVSYGLTLKSGTKEYESHQVDLVEELPVSDGADLFSEFEKLSDEMAEYLDRQHKRIKGLDSDTGI